MLAAELDGGGGSLVATDDGAVPGPDTSPASVEGVVVEGGSGKPGPPVTMLSGGRDTSPEGAMDGLKCSRGSLISTRTSLDYSENTYQVDLPLPPEVRSGITVSYSSWFKL